MATTIAFAARRATPSCAPLSNVRPYLRHEILNGKRHFLPEASAAHVQVTTSLIDQLARLTEGDWSIFEQPRVRFSPTAPDKSNLFVPDLVGWRNHRLSRRFMQTESKTALTPNWVCEVLSPGAKHEYYDRMAKMRVYARSHVPYVWLIDPHYKTLDVYKLEIRPGGTEWVLFEEFKEQQRAHIPPMDGVEIDLAKLWE
jgi:Uma2 family endonuclease